jgi:hypothetical protein
MLYVREPSMPVPLRRSMSTPIPHEPDQLESAAEVVAERASLLKKLCVMTGDNQRIAQHRDTLRYASTRGGGFKPQLRRFAPGDFVYVRQPGHAGPLRPEAKQLVLQVLEVRAGGVLLLQGKCGSQVTTNMRNSAPCHNPT